MITEYDDAGELDKILNDYDIQTNRYCTYGLYLAPYGDLWIAIDNTTGDAFTEEFHSKTVAKNWLMEKYDTDTAKAIDLRTRRRMSR